MPDQKITELTQSNLPLSGAEELAIVQGGVTKKTNVSNLYSNFNSTLNSKEDTSNKVNTMTGNSSSNTLFLTAKAVFDWAVWLFQPLLVSGTNIKTINNASLLGSGDLSIGTPNNLMVQTIQTTNLPNANGDDTFSKKIVSKVDGTFGIEDKDGTRYSVNQLGVLIRINEVILPSNTRSISNSFFSSSQLSKITLNNGLETIGAGAFSSNQLTSITFPNSITSIGEGAFQSNLLTSVTLPNSITSIGEGAFSSNQLTSVTFPNSIISIGVGAFYYNQLTSVTLPNSITSIGEGAFYSNQLTSVTLPVNCTYKNNSFDIGVIITGGVLIP